MNRDRGRESGNAAPPPSKPDRRVSRIRLSSQWVLLREGAALRLVPKSVGRSFGRTQASGSGSRPSRHSPHGHSRWFAFPSYHPTRFHLPAFPSLHGRYPLLRYYGRSDSRQPGPWTVCPIGPPAPAGLPDYGHKDFRPFRLQPSACRPGATRLSGDSVHRLSPALQASPVARRLAHPHRPNRVHVSLCIETLLRTGRSRSVAPHPVLPRRSYGSIPHGSSPQENGLPPFHPHALSGARARTSRSARSWSSALRWRGSWPRCAL